MAIESERSQERVEEESREGRRERRHRLSDVAPVAERSSAIPDAAAIEAARARALAVGVTTSEEKSGIIDTAKKVGKGGLKVMGGSLVAFTYLGYQTSRPVLFTAAHALDWIGQKMNKLADKLIDKKIPILSWFLNPVISFLDSSAKKLGIDKTLAEHLKKNAEDRKKLAEKVFKDYMEAQKKAEKKVDDTAKKKLRQKKLKEVLGEDVASALEGEFQDLENAEAAKTASASATASTETSKVA